MGTERFAYLAQLYFMDAIGDVRETRAFMTALRGHLSRWLARLRAIEQDVVARYGDAPERYGDAGFHRFAALRMGCDETLAAIDRRLASGDHRLASRPAAAGEPGAREDLPS